MSDPIPLSPSSIRDLSCAFKFRELRILRRWGKQRAPSTFLMNGRAAHSVFAQIFDPRSGHFPPNRDQIESAISRAVASEHYADDTSRKLACQWIGSLVPVYLAFQSTARKVLAVEQSAEFPLCYDGRRVAQVSARLDRIEQDCDDPETLILVDLSYGQKTLTPHQIWMALAAAKHLYRNRGFTRHRMEVHSIDAERVHVSAWWGSDVKGIHREVGALAAAFQIANEQGTVEAQIGETCLYCPLKADGRCPVQIPVDINDLGFDDEDDH